MGRDSGLFAPCFFILRKRMINSHGKKRLARIGAIHLVLGAVFLIFTQLLLPQWVQEPFGLLVFSALSWLLFVAAVFVGAYFHLVRKLPLSEQDFFDDVQGLSLPALKKVVEDMQLGVTICDLSGRIIYVNPAEAQMHGYRAGELVGRDVGVYALPEKRRSLSLQEFREFRRWKRESVNVTGEGRLFPVQLMSDLIYDYQQNPVAVITTCEDISYRKDIEEALKENEQQYRSLVESAHELIISLSPEAKFDFVNQAWLSGMGYSASQSQELSFYDTLNQDSKQLCREAFSRVMTGVTWHNLEATFISQDGREYVVDGNLTPKYHQGKVVGVLGVFRDITQRKTIDDIMRRSEKHYRLLINNAIDMIMVLDSDATIRYHSPSVEAVSGYGKEHLSNRNIRDFVHPDDLSLLDSLFKRYLKVPGVIPKVELRIRHRDGRWMNIEAVANNQLSDPAVSGIVVNARDITQRLTMEKELKASEEKHRMLLNSIQSPVLAIRKDMTIFFCNQAYAEFVGKRLPELEGKKLLELFPKFASTKSFAAYQKAMRTGDAQVVEGMVEGVYLKARIFTMDWGVLSIAEDITAQHQAMESLKDSEERFRSLADSAADAIISINQAGQVVFWNKAAERIFGYEPEDILGEDVDLLTPERFRGQEHQGFKLMLASGANRPAAGTFELAGRRRDGYEMPMELSFSAASIKGQNIHTCIVRDVTERKQIEKQLKFLSFHDSLTGLYNRGYFEEELQRLKKARLESVGLLITDVDGLKLVNDTMGHKTGDGLLTVMAGIIKDCCRQGDVVARIGGDEFGAILPNCSVETIEQACQRIREVTGAYNAKNPELPLSLSVGWAVRPGKDMDINRLFHEADDNMYREKVRNHDVMVKNFIQALQKKNLTSEEQIGHLGHLMKDLAREAGVNGQALSDIELLARYHDIGNVLVADRVLLKAGHLTKPEEEEMKRHCEIGYHIAASTPYLMAVADWILKHHERWDGKGYPMGLKAEAIPLESRILALAAAYMAMRQNRPYAKAIPHAKAVEEIKKESGKQFDPKLVEKFLKIASKWKDMPDINVSS